MDVRAVRAQFERDLHVALEAGLPHAAQDVLVLPGVAHDVIHQGGDGHIAGRRGGVGGQQAADFLVLAGLDVVGIRLDVLGAVTQFQFSHGSLLHFFFGLPGAVRHGVPDLFGLCGLRFQFFERAVDRGDLLRDSPGFLFQRVQVRFRLFKLFRDLPGPLFDLAPACEQFFTRHGLLPPGSVFSGSLRSCAAAPARPGPPPGPRRSIRRRCCGC